MWYSSKKPSTSSSTLATLSKNAEVLVVAVTQDSKWMRIITGSGYGYVLAEYISESQGSEFKAVVLMVSEGADLLFTRNLLYTAMTRAKQLLVVVGSPARLAYMVNNVTADKRYSGLKFMLKNLG